MKNSQVSENIKICGSAFTGPRLTDLRENILHILPRQVCFFIC